MNILDNISSVKFDRATAAGVLAETLTRGGKWWLIGLRLHLSGAAAVEDLTVNDCIRRERRL